MDQILEQAHRVALNATALARQIIRERGSAELNSVQKGVRGDVVTDIDYKSEHAMVEAIRGTYPLHKIISEEYGEMAGKSEWTWLIDPLDGTNNMVLDLPLFGSCVTLCHHGSPVVAAIYAGHEDATYSAVAGQGAFRNGRPIFVRHCGGPETATVSWIHGYDVQPDDPFGHNMLAILERRFKRTLSLWAPSVDWSLLVKGRIGAVVAYENEVEDLLCGALIAAEAGAVITDLAGQPVGDLSNATSLVVAAPEIAAYVADVLAELRADPVIADS